MECSFSRINSRCTKLLFDAKQLIVFCNTFTAARSTGLDLAGVQCDRQIRDRSIFCLAGAMRGYGGVARVVCHLDCLKCLRYGTDLIQLDQD